jgi:lipopolysaccharide/colanic/teichoic acid biosynthesis glycosyltransferase
MKTLYFIRFFDILFSFFAIIILSPLFLLIMIILKLTGEREVFFLQKRTGLNGRDILVFKFVTMIKNSENIGTETLTLKNDPRILPFGQFLRKSKLNELPQLFNVLIGNMSLIGPRPLVKRDFESYPERYHQTILSLKPGLSGLGSIIFRDEEELMSLSEEGSFHLYDKVVMPYKCELELWYVKNQTLYNYFLVIFLTIWVIISSNASLCWKCLEGLPVKPTGLKKLI